VSGVLGCASPDRRIASVLPDAIASISQMRLNLAALVRVFGLGSLLVDW
jgi:hypothetical protein